MAAPAPPRAPTRPDEVAAALRAAGIRPSRRLGQSFLTDPFVADAEAALVGTARGEPVLEVGGGLGILTEALLRRGIGPITVVEKDPRLARHLRATFDEVTVVEGDALSVTLPEVAAAVGNLPFSVGTPILERLWSLRVPRVVALLQREVVDRLVAAPGSRIYGRLTVWAALYGSVEAFRTVPSTAFQPAPAVEGRLVVHTRSPGPVAVSPEQLERVLRALFSSRRKQLGNLMPRLVSDATVADRAAADAGWPTEWRHRRPETLPPEAFIALARRLAGLPRAR